MIRNAVARSRRPGRLRLHGCWARRHRSTTVAHALAFPSFGPERRGAPMRAFTKLSDEPIGDRSAVAKADYVIYLDDTLLGEAGKTG